MVSNSRKVNGYVKAFLRHQKLSARLQKAWGRLEPLKRKVDQANVACFERRGALTGGQLAEANKLLEGTDNDRIDSV